MDAKQVLKAGFGSVQRGTDRVLDGLTDIELHWQPRPDANSIALILFHMAHSEDSFVHHWMQQKPKIWESEKWFEKLGKERTDTGGHYTAEQVGHFRISDIKDVKAYGAAVRQKSLAFLEEMTAEKLDLKVVPPIPAGTPGAARPNPFPFEPTIGSLLILTVTHLSQHVGEISYLRGLQRGMDK